VCFNVGFDVVVFIIGLDVDWLDIYCGLKSCWLRLMLEMLSKSKAFDVDPLDFFSTLKLPMAFVLPNYSSFER